MITKERELAKEKMKELILDENIKNNWTLDWENEIQIKNYVLGYNHMTDRVDIGSTRNMQTEDNELYFSQESLENRDFILEIMSLWYAWKGVKQNG